MSWILEVVFIFWMLVVADELSQIRKALQARKP